MSDAPKLIQHRSTSARAAIVLLHGFGGDAAKTWGSFPRLLQQEASLAGWDLYSIGYSTSLAFDIAGIWSADPEILTLGGLVDTVAGVPPLNRYGALAFVAHSMGGLMLQRGLLSSPVLVNRVSHVLLFGTPSAGLEKASPFAFWKRQLRDMARDSKFIAELRRDWSAGVGTKPPFEFVTVAGDRDEFVPRFSSLDPFPEAHRRVIYGNHLEIVKPSDADHLGYKVAVHAIAGQAGSGPLDAARLAIESRKFHDAIDTLWPGRAGLDEKGLVTLSLALDSVGRRQDAIDVLLAAKKSDTDARGTLAGRLKRRWLVEHRRADAELALSHYREALDLSLGKSDAQAFYHAINCAFMELAYGGDITAARDYAERALVHCRASRADDVWRHATEGEANIYVGDGKAAIDAYRRAMATARGVEPWQAASMYQQAVRAADLTGDEDLVNQLPAVFGQRSA